MNDMLKGSATDVVAILSTESARLPVLQVAGIHRSAKTRIDGRAHVLAVHMHTGAWRDMPMDVSPLQLGRRATGYWRVIRREADVHAGSASVTSSIVDSWRMRPISSWQ